MLVGKRCKAGRPPACNTLSQQIDAKNERDPELGEGRVRQIEIINFEKFGCNRLTNVFQHPRPNLLDKTADSCDILTLRTDRQAGVCAMEISIK